MSVPVNKPKYGGVILRVINHGVTMQREVLLGKEPGKDFYVVYSYYNRKKQYGANSTNTFADKKAAYRVFSDIIEWLAYREYCDEDIRAYLVYGIMPEGWEDKVENQIRLRQDALQEAVCRGCADRRTAAGDAVQDVRGEG